MDEPATTPYYFMMEDKLKKLKEIRDIQCSDGNFNFDPYMHGMANGLILALSIMTHGKPEYLDAPNEWLKNKET
jgi:hypothetical protein